MIEFLTLWFLATLNAILACLGLLGILVGLIERRAMRRYLRRWGIPGKYQRGLDTWDTIFVLFGPFGLVFGIELLHQGWQIYGWSLTAAVGSTTLFLILWLVVRARRFFREQRRQAAQIARALVPG